jgi:hypothetical protein
MYSCVGKNLPETLVEKVKAQVWFRTHLSGQFAVYGIIARDKNMH